MNPDEIQKGRIYKGTSGPTRRVQTITGAGVVKFRDSSHTQRSTDLSKFAEWAVQDVTPATSSPRLVKKPV